MPGTAVSTKMGGPKPGLTKANCLALKAENDAQRKKFTEDMEKKRKRGLNQQEKADLRKAKRGGMTYSSAKTNCGGGSGAMTQSSSGLANSHMSADIPGGTSAQKVGLNQKTRDSSAKRHDAKKKRAGTLCGGSYVHPGGGKGAHAEAKIMNNLSNANDGGSMSGCRAILNIDWRSNIKGGGVRNSGMPCPDCAAMLCHAMTECKMEIAICDADDKPQQLTEDDCKGKTGYANLSEKIDGGYPPGR